MLNRSLRLVGALSSAVLVASLVSLAGCGDSGTSAGGSGTGGSGGSGGTGNGGSGGSTSSGPAGNGLVINELQPQGAEWVELANTGDADVDLEGYGLCDEDATGACEIASAIRFPAGTTLKTGEFLLIVTDQDPALGVGPQNACLGGVTSCFYAPWKISAADGETIRLVDGSDDEVSALTLPPNATADETESWGLLPDGEGEPQLLAATPGAPNQAP